MKHMINLDDKRVIYYFIIDRSTAVYFDSFGIESISQEVLNKIKEKSITHNIFRIQDNDSIMGGFYCTAFIEYMLARNTLLDYNNLFLRMTIKISISNSLRAIMSSLKFRLKKIDKTRNYLLKEIKQWFNEWKV